ncbi:cell envelope integrity protein TolA [Sphaerotilus sp.]|uniref:cell envelope integrity protein TolA n=1 Tax=Sphaerotilus sp. TaxID=2093942 RepID=UPI0025E67746|nr:cell envelope integrity protein TolA [Sphaerotilus sp.]
MTMARPTPSPAPPPHDPVRNPPSADSLRLGTTVALIAHAGLIAALAFGVAWKRQEIATVSAELWSAVPQQAAPVPRAPATPTPPLPPPPPPAPVVKVPTPPAPTPKVIEPPPAPRDADIAREKADKRRRDTEEANRQAEKQAKLDKAEKAEKAERAEQAAKDKADQKAAERKAAEKAEAKAAEKAAATEKAKEAAQQEKTAKAREDNLKRLQKQLGDGGDAGATTPARPATPPGGTGTAAQSSGQSAGYAGRLRAYLLPKLFYPDRTVSVARPTIVRVRVAPDGTILSRELVQSSGQADWDQAVLNAIDKAGILPRDTDNRVPSEIDIPWKP